MHTYILDLQRSFVFNIVPWGKRERERERKKEKRERETENEKEIKKERDKT